MYRRHASFNSANFSKLTAILAVFLFLTLSQSAVAQVLAPNSSPNIELINNSEYSQGIKPKEIFSPDQPTFKVVYEDDDNDPPTYLNVVINGISYSMVRVPNQTAQYFDGVEYSLSLSAGTLNTGDYSYHFESSDGQFTFPWMSTSTGDIINYTRVPSSGELNFEIKRKGNDPVIIIPGILGSAEKDGVLMIDPILHTYDNLIDTLAANGYVEGQDLFTFPYNWRNSNVDTAKLLKDKIATVKNICNCDKVDLVAHSMGGLVARQYIQSSDYVHDVDQLIFLGTPHLGSPSAYLSWDGGTTQPGFDNSLVKLFLFFEAKKLGYKNIFDYIKNRPIASVQELLPIYSYIHDKDVNVMREYPNNYPVNTFLENLNNTSSSLFNSGIKITNIVGDAGVFSTISSLRVVPSAKLPLWENGYPEGFDEKISDRGLENGPGDGTVPSNSAESISIGLSRISSGHLELPTNGEDKVYTKLTDKIPNILVQRSLIRRLLTIKLFSPVDMVVVAPDGKRIGKDFVSGEEVNEIDGAFYSGFENDDEYITIPNPIDGEYKVQTIGTDNGGEYTVATGLLTDQSSSEHDFKGTTLPGMVTDLNVEVSSASNTVDVVPNDVAAPIIIINSPQARDYLRSEVLTVDTTSTDAGTGVFLHQASFDDKIVNNGVRIDLFFEHLGNHSVTVTSSDFVGNIATATVSFQLAANVSSIISDIERAFSLGWIDKLSVKKDLIKELEKIQKERRKCSRDYDAKQWKDKNSYVKRCKSKKKEELKEFLKELRKERSKHINEQAFLLIQEDINWLINNLKV